MCLDPMRYTPAPRHNKAIVIAAGIIHAPNIRDRGRIIKISSRGENIDNPIIRRMLPIIRCFNKSPRLVCVLSV